jgi:Tol biopolymer transport system component
MTKPLRRTWTTASLFIGLLGLLVSGPKQVRADEAPEPQEEFTTRIFLANTDGSNMRPLVDLPEYQAQGSPCWSADGKLIAFDAWKPQLGEKHPNSRMIIVNADGSNPRIFDDASMPSFSPGGHRIAYSRPQARGVWVISLDAESEEEAVQIDPSGWGTAWSPDGKIVYAVHTTGGANLRVVNIVEGRRDYVFSEEQTPYTQIFWNMAWSPDGKRIVYKAAKRGSGKQEVGIVDARGEKFGLVTRDEGDLWASFAWSPDASKVLFTKKCPERQRFQIYSAAPDSKDPPQLLPALDPLRNYADIAYSPDGKQLLISCQKRTPAKKPKP